MKPSNPFKNASGKASRPFAMEAEAWDMCLKSVKDRGVHVTGDTWEADISTMVYRMRKPEGNGYLCFIPDE